MNQPPVADALAFFTTGAWQTEEEFLSGSSSSTYTAGRSEDEDSLEENGEPLEESIIDGASDSSSSQTTWPAGVSWEGGLKFSSQEDLLAWVHTLPQIRDEQNEEDSSSSSSTSDVPSESTLPPPSPIFAVEQEQPLQYIPLPKEYRRVIAARRAVDTEDLWMNVVNNLRWERYFASEPSVFPPAYERDLPPPELLGTPPRNIDERTKLEPPTSAYKYTLDSSSFPSLAARTLDDGANTYSASELFGPDASTVKVARCAPIRPRARTDLCELTSLEHTLRRKAGEATDPSATVKAYADPCAVEFWKASVNEVVEQVRAAKSEEDTARLEAELRAFFEEAAADDDDDFEAVEIPDESEVEVEADASFDGGYVSTVSESGSEEDGEGVFDYDQWVADCQAL
ncbi:hypothetical protein V8D89_001786 [Ganoderma adspersum]